MKQEKDFSFALGFKAQILIYLSFMLQSSVVWNNNAVKWITRNFEGICGGFHAGFFLVVVVVNELVIWRCA